MFNKLIVFGSFVFAALMIILPSNAQKANGYFTLPVGGSLPQFCALSLTGNAWCVYGQSGADAINKYYGDNTVHVGDVRLGATAGGDSTWVCTASQRAVCGIQAN